MNARVLFARTKPRTVREIQKELFEEQQKMPFPYSISRFEDKELAPLTDDDLLAIDHVAGDLEDPVSDEEVDWEAEWATGEVADESAETERAAARRAAVRRAASAAGAETERAVAGGAESNGCAGADGAVLADCAEADSGVPAAAAGAGGDANAGSGGALRGPSQKDLAKMALGYFQKAVTEAMKRLTAEERMEYELRAKLARAKGLTAEDKHR